MIAPQSLEAHFYFNEILDQVSTLEVAFDKLYTWDRHHSTLEILLRQWRSLPVLQFKTPDFSWAIDMEKLYGRATLIQGQLDPIHKHDVHLTEVREDGIREEPFYMFVDTRGTADSAHSFFQGCLAAIAKQADIDRIALKQHNQLACTCDTI